VALDLTELAERLAERFSLARVAIHDLDRAPRDAEAHRGERQPLDLEVPHHVADRVALGADEVRGRDLAIVEHELRGRRSAHTELVLDLLSEPEARRALLDDELRERARALVAGPRVDEEDCRRARYR